MEVTVHRITDSKFEIEARGHRLICDQPRENGGEDSGIAPPELLLASLASCAAYYAAQYLRTRGLVSEELTVRVTAEKAQRPARLGSFRIEVTAPDVPAEHEAPLLRAVKACLIHNTLTAAPEIEIVLHNPVRNFAQ